MFTVVQIFSDSKGDSHFEDIVVPLAEAGSAGMLSKSIPAKNIIFREVESTYESPNHPVPQRHYIFYRTAQLK